MAKNKDIYGKAVTVQQGPLAKSETTKIFIGGAKDPVGLAQNVQIGYGQALTRVYEIGSLNTYMVSGRTQGTVSMDRMVGKSSNGNKTLRQILGDDFFVVEQGGDSKNAGGVMRLKDQTVGVEYICTGCYVTQSSTGIDSNGSIVTENISMEVQKVEVLPDKGA